MDTFFKFFSPPEIPEDENEKDFDTINVYFYFKLNKTIPF